MAVIVVWAEGPADVGARAAVERLNRHDMEVPAEVTDEAVRLAQEALDRRHLDPPARATELFVEVVVVAAAIRSHYDESPLTAVDVDACLGVSQWFTNSLWHGEL